MDYWPLVDSTYTDEGLQMNYVNGNRDAEKPGFLRKPNSVYKRIFFQRAELRF